MRHALALGALHGPAELLPISSSGHVTLVPWLAGWPYAEVDPELRKAFEVALHAGTAAALLIGLRAEVAEAAHGLDARRAALIAWSFAPPAAAGLAFERQIESRLGTPATIAVGLVAGSIALLVADRAAQTRSRPEATWRDGLALGIAQACALIPGVSRNGATLAVARARRFRRVDANELSRHVALPVIAGASALKGVRLARRGLPGGVAPAFTAGATASFASTLAALGLVQMAERGRPVWPYAAYRLALAGVVAGRLVRQNGGR